MNLSMCIYPIPRSNICLEYPSAIPKFGLVYTVRPVCHAGRHLIHHHIKRIFRALTIFPFASQPKNTTGEFLGLFLPFPSLYQDD